MTQSGQPGAPPPGGQPPAPPPQAPPPPPPTWQSTPQPPAAPPPAAPSMQSQMPAWTGNLTSTVPVAGPAGYFYADVPNRFIAMVIDVIIMLVIFFIIGAITVVIFGNNIAGIVQTPTTLSLLAQAVVSYGIWAVYFVYLWTAMRGTLGMKVLGMQIGDEGDGKTITYNQGLIRFAVLFGPQIVIGLLASFVPGLGFLGLLSFIWLIYVLITMAQSQTKQGIQDKMAKTMVVKAGRSVIG